MRKVFVLGSVVVFILSIFLPLQAQQAPPDTGKMSWELFQLVTAGQRKRAAGEEVPELTVLLISGRPLQDQDLQELERKGYTVLGAYGYFALVKAPMDHFAREDVGLNTLDFVSNASLPPPQITNDLPTPFTSGTPVIRADLLWRQGFFGDGVKIAVIDVGYDPEHPRLAGMSPQPIYYNVIPLSRVYPFPYIYREGEVATDSPHGTSCALIVHDVAPHAQLYLLSYPSWTGLVGWLCALDCAVRKLGVDVVTSSVEFSLPTCHADGTGPLNEMVNRILQGTKTLFFLAAGNWAMGSGADRTHYYAVFTDEDKDDHHDFTSTDDTWDRNTLVFEAKEGDQLTIVLEWDAWGSQTASCDLDLYLYDADYRVPIAYSLKPQYGKKDAAPFESIGLDPNHPLILPYTGRYAIVVEDAAARYHGGSSVGVSFHLYLFNRSDPFPFIEHHTSCSSVREVATNPDVIAVGAFSPKDGTVRPYSSRGLTGAGLSKPEILAPDGVTGTVYERFYGTSAAAPYAAGAAALLIQANDGSLTKEEFLAYFQADGEDICHNSICKLVFSQASEGG